MTESDQRNEVLARDRDALKYDEWYLKKGYYYDWVEKRSVIGALGLTGNNTVLDAGCGTGRIAIEIAEKCRKVYGVDFSAKSIDVLEEKARSRGIVNIEARVGDIRTQPLPPEGVDRIVSVQVVQHIPDENERRETVRRFYEILKPGGICVVECYNWNRRFLNRRLLKEGRFSSGIYYFRFSPAEMRSLFEDAGFRDVAINGCVNFTHYGAGHPYLRQMARLDLLLSRFRFSSLTGEFLLARGVR